MGEEGIGTQCNLNDIGSGRGVACCVRMGSWGGENVYAHLNEYSHMHVHVNV